MLGRSFCPSKNLLSPDLCRKVSIELYDGHSDDQVQALLAKHSACSKIDEFVTSYWQMFNTLPTK